MGCSGSPLGCVGSAGTRLGRDRDFMACDAATGPLVQSGWLSPFCALHQPWAPTPWSSFQGKVYPCSFPLADGQSSIPTSPEGQGYRYLQNSVGHGPPGLPGGSAWACGTAPSKGLRAGEAAKGCSQGMSPALAAAAHPDADSLVMLAYSSVLLFRGWTGTWGNCYCPVREVTKSQQSRGTCPELSLSRQTLHWYRTAPLFSAPWPALPFPTPCTQGLQNPHFNQSFSGSKTLTRVFLVFLQVL